MFNGGSCRGRAFGGSSDAFAPLDRKGPPLSVAPKKLAAAIECSENPAADQRWVLLIHGTGADSQINWSWNHIPALDQLGIPWCTVDLPVGGSGDLQSNAEYVVNAIRVVHRRSGKRIGIIGHSQGGISPRWAFRFWPDTRKMVDDLVGYAPPNHGSASADATCEADGPCSPSSHQFRTDSQFNGALNSFTETFPGISYTNVYSHTDFIATPNADDSGTAAPRWAGKGHQRRDPGHLPGPDLRTPRTRLRRRCLGARLRRADPSGPGSSGACLPICLHRADDAWGEQAHVRSRRRAGGR